MAFKRLLPETQPSNPAGRILISGPPNTWKTGSVLQWPRPLAYLCLPGEKGHDTIPNDTLDLAKFVWEFDDVTKMSPTSVLQETETLTREIIAGKHGKFESLAVDGLHKLHYWYYRRRRLQIADWVITKESDAANERQLDLTAYGGPSSGAYAEFMLWLSLVLQSPIPYVVATVWEEPEPDDPSDRQNRSSHTFPALPGKLAKQICGEFSVVLSAAVTLPDIKGQVKGEWQIRPQGKIWGVGVKVAPEIAKRLPAKMPQDFESLRKLLGGGE